MRPYYEHGGVTIYHGDCREVLGVIGFHDAIVTDPVWPNARVPLFGSEDPEGMMREMFAALGVLPFRLAVHLGCDTDPRFLGTVPATLPFFRVAWLEIVRAGYRGRLMHTGDVGYLFGAPPRSIPGQRVIPGRMIDPSSNGKQSAHPCPRKIAHVQWLVRWWTEAEDTVLDPFAGSGTTGLACKGLGRRCTLIEVDESYCEIAAHRLSQGVLDLAGGKGE